MYFFKNRNELDILNPYKKSNRLSVLLFLFDKANLKWKIEFLLYFDTCNFKRIYSFEIYII